MKDTSQAPVMRVGRGSASNLASRFVPLQTLYEADGWDSEAPILSSLQTQLHADRTRRLITHNQSPDIGFDQSINPYKGCEHGCIYCFARPTHAYLDLSPGLDFESQIFYKTDVREHLLTELSQPGYVCRTLAIGTNTDPYQPAERQHRLMREILEVLLECGHPVSIVTKSSLILRDLDLLAALAEAGLVCVYISVTTLDRDLKTRLEPRTAAPSARLRTIAALRAAGVPTGAMLAPIIPFINDQEIEALVAACAQSGAQTLGYILLRLPREVRPLFEEWLQLHFPLRAARVMAAVRGMRGGRAYDAQWHQRMVGQGPMAQLLQRRFQRAVSAAGLTTDKFADLRTDRFVAPARPGDPQLRLF